MGSYRWVDGGWSSTRQTLRSEKPKASLTWATHRRRRAGLRSSPQLPLLGSGYLGSDPKWLSRDGHFPTRVASDALPGRPSGPVLVAPSVESLFGDAYLTADLGYGAPLRHCYFSLPQLVDLLWSFLIVGMTHPFIKPRPNFTPGRAFGGQVSRLDVAGVRPRVYNMVGKIDCMYT